MLLSVRAQLATASKTKFGHDSALISPYLVRDIRNLHIASWLAAMTTSCDECGLIADTPNR
jgi:hypothetical protein